jgi:outer membrane murein-binding lipoprotein Lpp
MVASHRASTAQRIVGAGGVLQSEAVPSWVSGARKKNEAASSPDETTSQIWGLPYIPPGPLIPQLARRSNPQSQLCARKGQPLAADRIIRSVADRTLCKSDHQSKAAFAPSRRRKCPKRKPETTDLIVVGWTELGLGFRNASIASPEAPTILRECFHQLRKAKIGRREVMSRIALSAVVAAAVGASLTGCSSAQSSNPSSEQVQTLKFESDPPGADVRTTQGETCKTPCELKVPSHEQPVTITKNNYVPQTVQVALGPKPEHSFWENPPATLAPNPVHVVLQKPARHAEGHRSVPPPPQQ